MHLLLFIRTSVPKKARSLSVGTTPIIGFGALVLLLCFALFYAGYYYSVLTSREALLTAYDQIRPAWQQRIVEQDQALIALRQEAEDNIDMLSMQLALARSHIMRLDALGSRLVGMTGMEDIYFDESLASPGIGGPEPSLQGSVEISDIMVSIDTLQKRIKDRSDKLSAIESMLIDQVVQVQTMPAGRPSNGWISSLFGKRTDPMTGRLEHHAGIDFAGRTGEPVMAVAAGIVTWSGPRNDYGHLVEIDHGNGYLTRYAHNKENLVEVGEKVGKNQVVATMGSTGRSTGTHLHFEVIKNGKHVNPKRYLGKHLGNKG